MFQITIKKQDKVTNQAKFETESEANEWLAKEVENKFFGEPDRWLTQEYAEKYGLDIKSAIDEREFPGTKDDKGYTEYLFAAEYEIVTEDITKKVNYEKAERIQKEQKKSAATESLKIVDVDSLKTIAEIKPILKMILDKLLN